MGNRVAAASFLGTILLAACAAFLFMPSAASASRFDVIGPTLAEQIIERVNQRLCERQRALGERLRLPLIHPSFCAEEPEEPEEPTVMIDADPLVITAGATTTLIWSSEHADACTASGGWSGAKATSGSQEFAPGTTTTYTIECEGEGGADEDSVTVTVNPAPEPEELTLTFTADQSVVHEGSASEATTTLAWYATGATSCTASGTAEWSGSKAFDGEQVVTPTATTTYALDCTNGTGGTVHAEVTIGFVPAPEPDAPTVEITASRTTVIEGSADEATTTLAWESANADSCTASGGWAGDKALAGIELVTPAATTTYTIECTGPGGTAEDSVTVGFVPAEEPGQMIGHMVISEVYYFASSSAEWVEIYNGSDASVDLQGWSVRDETATDTIAISAVLEPGEYAVVIASTTPDGIPASIPLGVPVIMVSGIIGGSGGLANARDGVTLHAPSGELVDSIGWGTEGDPAVILPATVAVARDHSIAREFLTIDTDTDGDWVELAEPTPGQ